MAQIFFAILSEHLVFKNNFQWFNEIHKKSVTNALRHGLTNQQAKVVLSFLKSLINFKRNVVELIEDFGRHVPLER